MIEKVKNWRIAKREIAFNEQIAEFGTLFRKHLLEFVTGAFAFVAALVWKDAIQNSILSVKQIIPHIDQWMVDYTMAVIVTVISVLGILVVDKILKVEKR